MLAGYDPRITSQNSVLSRKAPPAYGQTHSISDDRSRSRDGNDDISELSAEFVKMNYGAPMNLKAND
jgi:hypothetical protein